MTTLQPQASAKTNLVRGSMPNSVFYKSVIEEKIIFYLGSRERNIARSIQTIIRGVGGVGTYSSPKVFPDTERTYDVMYYTTVPNKLIETAFSDTLINSLCIFTDEGTNKTLRTFVDPEDTVRGPYWVKLCYTQLNLIERTRTIEL